MSGGFHHARNGARDSGSFHTQSPSENQALPQQQSFEQSIAINSVSNAYSTDFISPAALIMPAEPLVFGMDSAQNTGLAGRNNQGGFAPSSFPSFSLEHINLSDFDTAMVMDDPQFDPLNMGLGDLDDAELDALLAAGNDSSENAFTALNLQLTQTDTSAFNALLAETGMSATGYNSMTGAGFMEREPATLVVQAFNTTPVPAPLRLMPASSAYAQMPYTPAGYPPAFSPAASFAGTSMQGFMPNIQPFTYVQPSSYQDSTIRSASASSNQSAFSRPSLAARTPSRDRPQFHPYARPVPASAAPAAEPVRLPETALPLEAMPEGTMAVEYTTKQWQPEHGKSADTGIYRPYTLQSITIPEARPHPSTLVQSASMAAVALPKPSYVPHLPEAVVKQGILSEAQLESVIYAGEAHSKYLSKPWRVSQDQETLHTIRNVREGGTVFRRGWFLGDGTGAGKGRQIAGIILDNWLKGRRKALWISKNDKLLEDAKRDWAALKQDPAAIVSLAKFAQDKNIDHDEGILFTTYAMLASKARNGKPPRIKQIMEWLGNRFDGVIAFDESHALTNIAGAAKQNKGSAQAMAGMRLQHAKPHARVLYVSATGATDVHDLAYAHRLGLWGNEDSSFKNQHDFIAGLEKGGVAAMETLARDMKALGLYSARSLSYDGVAYKMLEHSLSSNKEQAELYDRFARLFQNIHEGHTRAFNASPEKNETGWKFTRVQFEATKQRIFNNLISALKAPTLLHSIEQDVKDGHSALVQLISTGDSQLRRQLEGAEAENTVSGTPPHVNLNDDIKQYLNRSFLNDSPAGAAAKQQLLAEVDNLPPIQPALDQIIHGLGTENVAEITGRKKRLVRDSKGQIKVQSLPSSAAEAADFMDDKKRVLVFSDAGGTGKSYHADKNVANQRLRVHYLLELGWRADNAIQGLGRTNRTNQAQAPLFRPVTSDLKAEKRFLSTIARRLDTLGAITKGERNTGGQGLFRTEDNLESPYARAALRQLYALLVDEKVQDIPYKTFLKETGLAIKESSNTLAKDLPSMNTFLNRLLGTRVEVQNRLFRTFDHLLKGQIDQAVQDGTYENGLSSVKAESQKITARFPVYRHPNGSLTEIVKVHQKERNPVRSRAEIEHKAASNPGITRKLINTISGYAALGEKVPIIEADGTVAYRTRFHRPASSQTLTEQQLRNSAWQSTDDATFGTAWQKEVDKQPRYREKDTHFITGLLLPVWNTLPKDTMRTYKLETDDGEKVLGQYINSGWLEDKLKDGTLSNVNNTSGASR